MENGVVESSPTKIDGRLTSPDFVRGGSPDIPSQIHQESPEFSHDGRIVVSLENGIEGSSSFRTSPSKIGDLCMEASFELVMPESLLDQEKSSRPENGNLGSPKSTGSVEEFEGGLNYSEDVGVCVADTVTGEDSSESSGDVKLSEEVGFTNMSPNENVMCSIDGELQRLQMENALQKKDLSDTKMLVDELKKENEFKDRECREALKSLNDLQNELMRKSMHVGSLAFAIEGQVKEKSRWFSSLQDLTRNLKILKMDRIKLLEDASMFKQCLTEMEGVSSIVQSTMNRHEQLHEDVKTKFLQEAKERKDLYNKVLELKGNIRVFCRCRPFNTEEIDSGASAAVEFEAAKDGELTVKTNGASRKTFKFDVVFCPEADQFHVFEETSPLAMSVLDGYNVCIFAYGQTGTGKTFTMEGTSEARGVNYRTLHALFDIIEERKNTFKYEVSVSVLEVYNENIRDLLSVSDSAKRLEIKQVGERGHRVQGLVEAHVKNVGEVWEVFQTGSNGRVVGSTNVNEHSSRSHCMHCVMVKGENLLNGECTRSKMWLVDLAGSERIAKTEVQGDVISALANRSPHIPFRNSKLTHLLQDSLGGDSKTLMFVQISPNENDVSETLCSLNFASRVRGIELGPAKRQMDKSELFKYKQTAEKLCQDSKSKELQVKKLEDANCGLEAKVKERDVKTRSLQDKIKELESQLLVERQYKDDYNPRPLRTKKLVSLSNESQTNISSFSTSGSEEFSFLPLSINESMDDKENNPLVPRPPLCPRRITCSTRRNSLIPVLKMTNLPPIQDSPRDQKKQSKRGLLQKKIYTKSPVQKGFRTEKVRVSIVGRGRMGRRGATKDTQMKVNHREKERGWNSAIAGRTLLQ